MGKRAETQDRLLAATRHIIITEGIEATSLEHICAVAGFTRGAFYSNFSSKDSLLGILAEGEYADLIQRLRERVLLWENAQTPASQGGEGDRHLLMENLLYEALDAIHIDEGLYILHSEMLMRSIRDPEWGMRLLDLNRQFADQLGSVLQTILTAAGRELTVPIGALSQQTPATPRQRLVKITRRFHLPTLPLRPARQPDQFSKSSWSCSTPARAKSTENTHRYRSQAFSKETSRLAELRQKLIAL